MSESLGRLAESEKAQAVVHDAPSKTMEAVLSQLDAMQDALVALDAANTGVAEVAALKKIDLKL